MTTSPLTPAGIAATGTTQLAAQGQPIIPPNGNGIILRMEALLTRVETKLAADEAKVKSKFAQYWPIGAGLLIAATRFLHL